MNKKGLLGWIIFIILALGLCVILFLIFRTSGSSVDTAYGVEKNFFWYKLYLKDDHKTIYCIDKEDTQLLKIAQKTSEDKSKVKVTYTEYFFRGSLCNFDERYSSVVITNIEVLD